MTSGFVPPGYKHPKRLVRPKECESNHIKSPKCNGVAIWKTPGGNWCDECLIWFNTDMGRIKTL